MTSHHQLSICQHMLKRHCHKFWQLLFRLGCMSQETSKGSGASTFLRCFIHFVISSTTQTQFRRLRPCQSQFYALAHEEAKPATTASRICFSNASPNGYTAVIINCGTKPTPIKGHDRTVSNQKKKFLKSSLTMHGGKRFCGLRAKATSAGQRQISHKTPPFSQ